MREKLRVVDNETESRYELLDGERIIGFAEYKLTPERILFTYIDINPDIQGRGLGGRLTEAALQDCRARGLKVAARCPFIVDYLKEHSEYDDIAVPS